MSIVSPSSQKQALKPIGFLLDEDGTTPSADSFVELYIRPEELSVSSPSSISINRTLGGIWANVEGEGIKRITISGTTGWHNNGLLSTEGGLTRFKNLENVVFSNYFKKRAERLKANNNPSDVKVIFVDRLNELCFEVVPINFTLKRSKNRPLLLQYNIVMDVVNPDASSAYVSVFETSVAQGDLKALGSLSSSISSLTKFTSDLSLSSGLDCATELIKFGTTSAVAFNKVYDAYKSGGIISAGLSTLSVGMSSFGMNITQTLCDTLGIPQSTIASLMKGASAFGNIYCLLNNAFNSSLNISDYTKLLGASFCSSTSGGSSLSEIVTSGLNGFSEVFKGTTSTASGISGVTSDALKVMSSNGIGTTVSDVKSSLSSVISGIDISKIG